MSKLPVLGLISDTHGYFDPGVSQALAGVERILHAGDIGGEGAAADSGRRVLEALEKIAPVTAIRGNVDVGDDHPSTTLVLWHGLRIRMIHSLGDWTEAVRNVPADVVVCGHSHQPEVRHEDGVMIVNPGSAGKRRFRLPRTCARLSIEAGRVTVRHIDLDKLR